MAALALILAAAADTITFLAMGTAHEANPIAATWPALAVCAKAVLVVALLRYLPRYRTAVFAFGAAAWAFGALTNLTILAGG